MQLTPDMAQAQSRRDTRERRILKKDFETRLRSTDGPLSGRQFVTYKAALRGIPLVAVDPRHTSRTCPECWSILAAESPPGAFRPGGVT